MISIYALDCFLSAVYYILYCLEHAITSCLLGDIASGKIYVCFGSLNLLST